jgi:hypothetical protein
LVGRDTRIHFYNLRIMGSVRKWWRLWAKALGGKEGSNREADIVALWRTLIVLQAVITNAFIVWNILRKW